MNELEHNYTVSQVMALKLIAVAARRIGAISDRLNAEGINDDDIDAWLVSYEKTNKIPGGLPTGASRRPDPSGYNIIVRASNLSEANEARDEIRKRTGYGAYIEAIQSQELPADNSAGIPETPRFII